MKASKFTDAQKAFILKQGTGRSGRRYLSEGWHQPGDLFQLEEEVRRDVAA